MSSLSENAPLSALAASLMENDVSPSPMRASHSHVEKSCHGNWWSLVFYFLVIALVLYFAFFALRPSFVLDDCHSYSRSRGYSSDEQDDREINNGKLLGSAVVGALIIMFVFWLLMWLSNGSW